MNLEQLKPELEAAIPGCRLEIISNPSPSGQHSLLIGPEHALDLATFLRLDFRPVDEGRYPMFRLATQSMKAGGVAPAVFNASNEVAVGAFLEGRIPFLAIPKIVAKALDRTANFEPTDIASVLGADSEARRGAEQDVAALK